MKKKAMVPILLAVLLGTFLIGWRDQAFLPHELEFYGDSEGGYLLDKATGDLWRVLPSDRRAHKVFLDPIDELLQDVYWSSVVEHERWKDLAVEERGKVAQAYLDRLATGAAWESLSDTLKIRVREKIWQDLR